MWIPAPPDAFELIIPFSWTGDLEVAAGGHRLPITQALTITGVRATAGTAPTGAAAIIDVNINGTTAFTTQANRPTIGDGTNESDIEVPDVTALASGDYLTIDIDQIGSGDPGTDLTVAITAIREE